MKDFVSISYQIFHLLVLRVGHIAEDIHRIILLKKHKIIKLKKI